MTASAFHHDDGDRITFAFGRERELRQVRLRPMAHECVFTHTFQCVCCLRRRPDEDRQAPDSDVCIHCLRFAGIEMP
jgi:hypothetical protein